MFACEPRALIRVTAGFVWALVLIGLTVTALALSPTGVQGFGGCTAQEEPYGCASIYGVMDDALCGGGPTANCTNCLKDPASFCAPDNEEVGCQVENCVLDGYEHQSSG